MTRIVENCARLKIVMFWVGTWFGRLGFSVWLFDCLKKIENLCSIFEFGYLDFIMTMDIYIIELSIWFLGNHGYEPLDPPWYQGGWCSL
jgi:hypothetical protein